MLYCTNCGNKNELDSSFCNLCGTKISVKNSSHQSNLNQTTTYEHKTTENSVALNQPSQAYEAKPVQAPFKTNPSSMQNVSPPSQSTMYPTPHSQPTRSPTSHSNYIAPNSSNQYPTQPNTFHSTGYNVPSSNFTAAMILNWVIVALLVVFTIVGFLFSFYLTVTFLVLSIPLAWAGYAVRNHNKNARIVLIVLHCILCVFYLGFFPLSLVGLLISGFIIYVFAFDRKVTNLFKEKSPYVLNNTS